jgi:type III pantothenate kinase
MASPSFFAADVGNSRIKIGRFERPRATLGNDTSPEVPLPVTTLQLPVRTLEDRLAASNILRQWLAGFPARAPGTWFVASVNRSHDRWVEDAVAAESPGSAFHRLSFRHIPLAIRVEAPERVGLDRLAGAVAADRLRVLRGSAGEPPPAIVVDFGTAITVDLVSAEGAFEGGAILPGIAMAAEALARQTDALPRSLLADLSEPPPAVGKSTLQAIESGLLWGTVGAVRELIERIAAACDAPPLVFVTGGASPAVVPLLQTGPAAVVHLPELVLSGIAIAAEASRESFLAAGHVE